MILAVLALCIAIGVAGFFLYQYSKKYSVWEEIGEGLHGFGMIASIIVAITVVGLFVMSMCLSTADAKLEMYQEENVKIEEQIASTVERYLEYESGIFTELAPESSITLVSLYPELKGDKLVQELIDVYTANNEMIKRLRSDIIDRSVVNWLLYFGD